MPYLQASTDNPFGFIPYGKVLSIGAYRKDSAAAKIFAGDLVVLSSDGNVDVGTATSTAIIGVAVESSAASTTKEDFLIYDDPHQLFTVQDDSDTTGVTSTSVGNNVSVVATTGVAGTDRSAQELDSSTADTTSTLPMKIIDIHPIERTRQSAGVARGFATTTAQQRKWIVKINRHVKATNELGAVGI